MSKVVLRHELLARDAALPFAGCRLPCRRCAQALRCSGRRQQPTCKCEAVSLRLDDQLPSTPLTSKPAADYHEDHRGASTSSTLGWSTNFSSKFSLGELLGEGSFGVVRLAVHVKTSAQYAVKVLPKARAGHKARDTLANIRKEVSNWSAVQHCSFVVKLEGCYEDDSSAYIVQEVCSGGDLHQLLETRQSLTENEAAEVMAGVLNFLSECHKQSIFYGDVKPANFMLSRPYPSTQHVLDATQPEGPLVVKAVDFGCSEAYVDCLRLRKRSGTPLYMSPEVMMRMYDLSADVWSAGVMMYQLLSGQFPFWGKRLEQLDQLPPYQVMSGIMSNKILFPESIFGKLSHEAKDLITKLLDRDSSSRLTASEALAHPWFAKHMGNSSGQIPVGPYANNVIPMSPEHPLKLSRRSSCQVAGNPPVPEEDV